MTVTAVVSVSVDKAEKIDDQRTEFTGTVTIKGTKHTWVAERKLGNIAVKITPAMVPLIENMVRDHIKGQLGLINVPFVRAQTLIIED
jgi:hypothetical protein